MLRYERHLVLAASDLVAFLGCHHATALDRMAVDGTMEAAGDSPAAEVLRRRGLEHERDYLGLLQASGREVLHIPTHGDLARRARLTLDAMRAGVDVIYQAVLLDGAWLGIADFLIRSEYPSELGSWSYDIEDTKLASRVSPSHVIQLSVYARLVAGIQGTPPSKMSIVLGTGERADFRPSEFAAYVGLAAERLEAFVSDEAARDTTAEPCSHCDGCRWHDRCRAEWVEADHLSLVANIRRSQIDRLKAGGIATVAALANAGQGYQVPDMVRETYRKLQAQARLQVAVRADNGRIYELLPPEPGRGFERLPVPDPGDIFFDMEGDPLYPDGGLEYLFGVHIDGPGGHLFQPFWAHDRNEERLTFEAFMDFVAAHLERHPRAHIYHYNHYEVTAVRRLASRHGTRENVVDDMLRRHRFVDLFAVVREALRISEPRYSLKNVERFYQEKRDGEVATAVDSIVAYETWRVEHDDLILRDIETYNAIDCASTAGLQRWLIQVRPPGIPWFDPASVAPSPEALERQERAEAERAGLEAALTDGVIDENELAFRRLTLELTEFHRREQKPQWWALFDRQAASTEDHVNDADSLGGLRLKGVRQVKQSLLHSYDFPVQETKMRAGDRPIIADTLEPVGSIEQLDIEARRVVLKRSAFKGLLPEELSLGPAGPIDDKVLRAATVRFALSVLHRSGRFQAIERFLRREKPRLVGNPPVVVDEGVDLVAGTTEAVARLDRSHLFVQGPPGTGKTYTASRVIVEMIRRGRKVGVSSNSHKAINNLLKAVEEAALAAGLQFVGVKKSVQGIPETVFGGRIIVDVVDNLLVPLNADLIAGTAWLFARPEFEQRLDYLFVDEAGQVGLGNLVAMGTAAKNIVLVGDQMQLGQPIQGVHPGECGTSALEYLLQGAATVSPDRGVFLDVTHRMHPDLCAWVSEAIYDGRLRSHPSTERQALLLDATAHPVLKPTGLAFVAVEHSGCSQGSLPEAQVIREIWLSLMGQRWRDRHGVERPIGPDEVVVVAPYNVQVNVLREILPAGARVGTVDKFQGQEAAVSVVSMTTSSGDDMPRGIEFLFSRNRLNVAISRARCLSLVVASPWLLETKCGTVEEMRLVNTLCGASRSGLLS